jgi:hypothetical protein
MQPSFGNPGEHSPKRSAARTALVVVLLLAGSLAFGTCVLVGGIALLLPTSSPPPPPLFRHGVPSAGEYYGTWKSPDGSATLTISKDTVTWLKENKSGSTSSKVSLEGTFVGISPSGSVEMKMLVVAKTLHVSDPPHLDNVSGEWRMVVEGVELTRLSGPAR